MCITIFIRYSFCDKDSLINVQDMGRMLLLIISFFLLFIVNFSGLRLCYQVTSSSHLYFDDCWIFIKDFWEELHCWCGSFFWILQKFKYSLWGKRSTNSTQSLLKFLAVQRSHYPLKAWIESSVYSVSADVRHIGSSFCAELFCLIISLNLFFYECPVFLETPWDRNWISQYYIAFIFLLEFV